MAQIPILKGHFLLAKLLNMDALKDLRINSSALTSFVLSDEIHVFSRFSFSIFCWVRIEVWSPFYTAVILLNSGLIELKHCDADLRLMDMAKSFNYQCCGSRHKMVFKHPNLWLFNLWCSGQISHANSIVVVFKCPLALKRNNLNVWELWKGKVLSTSKGKQ
jgi:hypothetical protein